MPIFVNQKIVENVLFSGGECHVKLSSIDIVEKTNILAQLHNSNDIMCLLLTVDAVRRINAQTQIDLTIPYFPYARQDRVCNEGEALSVKVMADLINGLACARVTVFDAHSDVTPALLNNCKSISLGEMVVQSPLMSFISKHKLTLVSPDAGAEKKVRTAAKMLSKEGILVDVLCATKVRDTLTGHILETHIQGDFCGRNYILLDDICDGGRTFIELAQVLRSQGAADVYLYVTHGIFSQGLEPLKSYFKHVFCHHTMLSQSQIDPDFLTVHSC